MENFKDLTKLTKECIENETDIVTMTAVSLFDDDYATFIMSFRICNDLRSYDTFKKAVKAAVKEFSETPEYDGKRIDWSYFWGLVPNSICMKYGFMKCEESPEFDAVDWEEKLL